MKNLLLCMVLGTMQMLAVKFSADTVKEQLKHKGFDFLHQTDFFEKLTEQDHDADSLYLVVENAYAQYGNHMKQPVLVEALKKNKPNLFTIILQEMPDMRTAIKIRYSKEEELEELIEHATITDTENKIFK